MQLIQTRRRMMTEVFNIKHVPSKLKYLYTFEGVASTVARRTQKNTCCPRCILQKYQWMNELSWEEDASSNWSMPNWIALASNIPMLAIMMARLSPITMESRKSGTTPSQICKDGTTIKKLSVNPIIKTTTRDKNDVCIIRYRVKYMSARSPNSGKNRSETPITPFSAILSLPTLRVFSM